MARQVFPRRAETHESTAAAVLRRHYTVTGTPITLPVPIDMIIERTFGLEVSYEEIPEPADTVILGALVPSRRRIVINTSHMELLTTVMGPERFTLAHELAHWVYDAENPDQNSFDFESSHLESFCYHRESPDLPESDRIREINANKLASALLLPDILVRDANLADVVADLRGWAKAWGVSQHTLRIRLETLGLLAKPKTGPISL